MSEAGSKESSQEPEPSTLEKTPADKNLLEKFREFQAQWNATPRATREYLKRAYEKAQGPDHQPAPGRDYGQY